MNNAGLERSQGVQPSGEGLLPVLLTLAPAIRGVANAAEPKQDGKGGVLMKSLGLMSLTPSLLVCL